MDRSRGTIPCADRQFLELPSSVDPGSRARLTKVKYRAPHATEWEEKDLDWAMDRIAERVKATRDRDVPRILGGERRGRQAGPQAGQSLHHDRLAGRRDHGQRVELCPSQALAGPGADLARKPGPDMTQLDRARSGHFVRSRRRHDQSDRRPACRCRADHGLEHGRVPPGQLSLRDEGEAQRGEDSPRRSRFTRTSAMADVYAPLRAGTDIVFLGGLIHYILEAQKHTSTNTSSTYTNAACADHRGITRIPKSSTGLFSGFDAERKVRPDKLA